MADDEGEVILSVADATLSVTTSVVQPGAAMAEQPAASRVYLDVPFSENQAAKAGGARWDPRVKRWYDPHGASPALARWAARPQIPELLPGEDRTFGNANVTGRSAEALAHLQQVTGMTEPEAVAHIHVVTERPTAAPSHRRTADADAPADLGQLLATEDWHGGRDDLATHGPGIGVSREAARRRQLEGLGSDRSWRVGADGEVAVAEALAPLTTPSRLDRVRGRRPAWRVLHSVPIGTGRGDIDHVLIGPPGVTINTKHHRAGRLALDGDELVVNGHRSDYSGKARREAERATTALTTALHAVGHADLAGRFRVLPLLVIVGGRLLVGDWAPGVTVVMTRQLVHALNAMPATLSAEQVDRMYGVARHRRVWARSLP